MKYLVTAVLSFLCFVVVVHWVGGWLIPPTPDAAWIAKLYEKKATALQASSSPRVVLVGGSEVHYGVSAELMTEALGLPSVNFGTHGALGWQIQIEQVEPLLETGDIVLLGLNRYRMWHDSTNAVLANYVQQVEPSLLLTRPIAQWRR